MNLVNYYRVEKAIGYLADNFTEQPDLGVIADKVNLSPFHFQRIFTDWVGISPKKFTQYLSLNYLRQKIRDTENVIEAADLAGFSSQSRVHELFSIEGITPQQYKTSGKDLTIFYGYHSSPFGLCFIAVANQSICTLKFIDEDKSRDELRLFAEQWPMATLTHEPNHTQWFVKKIFSSQWGGENLKLLVRGTEFQLKVWEALLHIPFGSVATFGQIGRMIGQPGAPRAVGSAVAANTILYLIPCHRIILENGTMGNYEHGRARKRTMIGWEIAKAQESD